MNSSIPWPTRPPKSASLETPRHGEKPASTIRRQKKVAKPSPFADVPSLVKPALGPLECEVLQQVCAFGESTARQVLERIPHPLAYTTVMTTMTRLYRKGLLACRLSGRTFLYSPRFSSTQVELQLARDLVRTLVGCADISDEQLASVLLEVICHKRHGLLEELRSTLLPRQES